MPDPTRWTARRRAKTLGATIRDTRQTGSGWGIGPGGAQPDRRHASGRCRSGSGRCGTPSRRMRSSRLGCRRSGWRAETRRNFRYPFGLAHVYRQCHEPRGRADEHERTTQPAVPEREQRQGRPLAVDRRARVRTRRDRALDPGRVHRHLRPAPPRNHRDQGPGPSGRSPQAAGRRPGKPEGAARPVRPERDPDRTLIVRLGSRGAIQATVGGRRHRWSHLAQLAIPARGEPGGRDHPGRNGVQRRRAVRCAHGHVRDRTDREAMGADRPRRPLPGPREAPREPVPAASPSRAKPH